MNQNIYIGVGENRAMGAYQGKVLIKTTFVKILVIFNDQLSPLLLKNTLITVIINYRHVLWYNHSFTKNSVAPITRLMRLMRAHLTLIRVMGAIIITLIPKN